MFNYEFRVSGMVVEPGRAPADHNTLIRISVFEIRNLSQAVGCLDSMNELATILQQCVIDRVFMAIAFVIVCGEGGDGLAIP